MSNEIKFLYFWAVYQQKPIKDLLNTMNVSSEISIGKPGYYLQANVEKLCEILSYER